MSNLYFETKEFILTDYDIQKIASALTGYQLKRSDDTIRGYAFNLPGVIREITNPSVEYFIQKKETVKAIKLYRDINNCSLVEARDAINKIMEGIL